MALTHLLGPHLLGEDPLPCLTSFCYYGTASLMRSIAGKDP